ncbi:UTRA domain-containing protein [uncultured Flavonifractor sp.]|uniref:UTRA domain-containing protein n=1 Tax=uncultured Flavonifractor sp. TaxID=1193534 RepID=UPI003421D48A
MRQKCPANTKWHKLVRLRSAETFPLMIETSYLPQSRFITIAADILRDGSLYSYLEATTIWRSLMPARSFRP